MPTYTSTRRKRSYSNIPCTTCGKPRGYSSYKDICFNCVLKRKQQKLPLKKCECRNPDCKEMIPIMTMNGKPMRFAWGHNDKGNYKGGGRTSDGYIYTYTKNQTRTNKQGRIMKHRLVYEEYYNCCILPWIHIDHINGIKDDNRIENLQPLTPVNHNKKHNPRIGSDDSICSNCNSNKTQIDKRYDKPIWSRDGKGGLLCSNCYAKRRKLLKTTLLLLSQN